MGPGGQSARKERKVKTCFLHIFHSLSGKQHRRIFCRAHRASAQGQRLEERHHSLLILVTGLKNHSGKSVGINKLRQKRNIELSVAARLLSPVIYLVT